jgi:hypothetical protein
MPPELISLAILSTAAVAIGLLMVADSKGWRSPLPVFHLSRRSVGLTFVLLAVLAALQALRFAGVLCWFSARRTTG